MGGTKGKRILIVREDRGRDDIASILSHEGYTVTHAVDQDSALHRIKAWEPHLVIVEEGLPSDPELLSKIRNVSASDYTAVLLISSAEERALEFRGTEGELDDILVSPFRPVDLLNRVRSTLRVRELQDALKRSNIRIEEISFADEMTGLLNFTSFLKRSDFELGRLRKFRKPVSLLLINLDQFSTLNEIDSVHGANEVLSEAGKRIRGAIRTHDLAARVSGDEFAVLLPETDLAGAEFVAERVRDVIQQSPFKANQNEVVQLTACVGVAGWNTGQSSELGASELFKNASEALRSAKARGKAEIEVYSFV